MSTKQAFQRTDIQTLVVSNSGGSTYRIIAPKDVKFEVGQIIYVTNTGNKLDMIGASVHGFKVASLDAAPVDVGTSPAYKYVGTVEEVGGKALAAEKREAAIAAATKALDAALERESFTTKFERAKAFLSKDELALIESVIEKV